MSDLLAVTSYGTLRNNFGDRVGIKFTVGASALVATAIARGVVRSGGVSVNTQTHQLSVVSAATNLDLRTATVDPTGLTTPWAWADFVTPLTLAAGQSYYLLSEEYAGGDTWYDRDTVVAPAPGITSVGIAFRLSGTYYADTIPNESLVPVNLRLASASPLLLRRRRGA